MPFGVVGVGSRVTGAATPWVQERLAGPLRNLRVVHTGPDAVYLDDGDACLGLLSRHATQVPCAISTQLDSIDADEVALVGDGRLLVGSMEVSVARFVDAAVPRVAGVPEVTVVPELPEAHLLADGDPAAVPLLLGRGSGLTPYGDDVLCGWIATRIALGRTGGEVAATALRLAPDRTTLLSATLLACAARGEVIPEFRRVLLGGPVEELLAVGHTSGHGLAAGMGLAA